MFLENKFRFLVTRVADKFIQQYLLNLQSIHFCPWSAVCGDLATYPTSLPFFNGGDFLSLFGKHFDTNEKNSIGRLTEEIVVSHTFIAARSKSIFIVSGPTPAKY